MNERFSIRLSLDGNPLPINSVRSDQGVILRNETDAWPRQLVLEFQGESELTRRQMDRIRHVKGWPPGQFKLEAFVDLEGRLVFTGTEADSLPGGDYSLRLHIEDLEIPDQKFSFSLKENGEGVVTVPVRLDSRRIRLKEDPSRFGDGEIRRLVLDPNSRLEGMTLARWLADPTRRPNRRACLMNVLAKLRATTSDSEPLIRWVKSIFFADVERIYAVVTADFLETLKVLAAPGRREFYDEGWPKAEIHQKLLERVATLEPDGARFKLSSFRQAGRDCLQAVVAIPPTPARAHYADLDIDLGNPLQDLEGLIIHVGELIEGTTDHLALYSSLVEGPAGPYLYYDVLSG